MLFRCVAFSFRGSILYDEQFDVRFHCICTWSTAFLCKLNVHSIVNTRTSYGCAVKSLGLWSTESSVRFTRKHSSMFCHSSVFQRVWIRRKLRVVDTNGPDEYMYACEWVSSNELQWKSEKNMISCVWSRIGYWLGIGSCSFIHLFSNVFFLDTLFALISTSFQSIRFAVRASNTHHECVNYPSDSICFRNLALTTCYSFFVCFDFCFCRSAQLSSAGFR